MVTIYPGLSRQLMQQLDRGAIDAAIITRPELLPQGLDCLDIAAEPMQLLAPPQTESDDPIELLRTRPFIRFDRNAIFGQMVERWLQKHKIIVRLCIRRGNRQDDIIVIGFNNLRHPAEGNLPSFLGLIVSVVIHSMTCFSQCLATLLSYGSILTGIHHHPNICMIL